MELQQIRYFLAVCKERSFTLAARRCAVKQPSLTQAIKRLEQSLGGALFVRSSPVQLTALGSNLLPLFTQIEKLAKKARSISAASCSQKRSTSAEAEQHHIQLQEPY